MNREFADRLVRSAATQLVLDQPELLAIDVAERSLTHHLANYIAAGISADLIVDVEYNRHAADPKRLRLPHRCALDTDLRATTVYPDIVVHERGSDRRNTIVLEVKKPGESLEYDEQKLRGFRDQLGYEHAGHVVIGLDASGRQIVELTWLHARTPDAEAPSTDVRRPRV